MRYQQQDGLTGFVGMSAEVRALVKEFGAAIVGARKGEKISSRTLAKQLQISRWWMSDIENGKKLPTVAVALRIADRFKWDRTIMLRMYLAAHPSLTIDASRLSLETRVFLAADLARGDVGKQKRVKSKRALTKRSKSRKVKQRRTKP